MIQLRHQQLSLWGAYWVEEVADLWEPWMRQADAILNDEVLLDRIYEAQGRRCKHSRRLGRKQTPAEVVLRMLILKHARITEAGLQIGNAPDPIANQPFAREGDFSSRTARRPFADSGALTAPS